MAVLQQALGGLIRRVECLEQGGAERSVPATRAVHRCVDFSALETDDAKTDGPPSTKKGAGEGHARDGISGSYAGGTPSRAGGRSPGATGSPAWKVGGGGGIYQPSTSSLAPSSVAPLSPPPTGHAARAGGRTVSSAESHQHSTPAGAPGDAFSEAQRCQPPRGLANAGQDVDGGAQSDQHDSRHGIAPAKEKNTQPEVGSAVDDFPSAGNDTAPTPSRRPRSVPVFFLCVQNVWMYVSCKHACVDDVLACMHIQTHMNTSTHTRSQAYTLAGILARTHARTHASTLSHTRLHAHT